MVHETDKRLDSVCYDILKALAPLLFDAIVAFPEPMCEWDVLYRTLFPPDPPHRDTLRLTAVTAGDSDTELSRDRKARSLAYVSLHRVLQCGCWQQGVDLRKVL